jgi:NhaA family Na+:H+ antiporter
VSWAAFFTAGVHPAFALIPIVPFLPHGKRDPGFFVDAPPGARDTLSRFERWCHAPAQAALLLFGLVNAGVSLKALEAGAWALPIAVLVGRPAGVLAAVAAAVALGLHLPVRVGWRELVVAAGASAIGFSLTLFLAAGLLAPGPLLNEVKMGALLTLAALPIGVAAARLLHVGRFAPEQP